MLLLLYTEYLEKAFNIESFFNITFMSRDSTSIIANNLLLNHFDSKITPL